MLRENYSKYWKMMVLFQRNRFVMSVFSIDCLRWKWWKFFFCTLPGLGMIHVTSIITDLASFSVYVSEYKKFHFPSHVMICLYAHNTWGTHNIYLNDDISSCSNLQYQTQINCPKTKTTLKVAAKHLSK